LGEKVIDYLGIVTPKKTDSLSKQHFRTRTL